MPSCGSEVPARAKACPECGACEQTGWSGEAIAQNLGLPDDSFDYDEFAAREFGPKTKKQRGPKQILWAGVALLLVITMTWWLVVVLLKLVGK